MKFTTEPDEVITWCETCGVRLVVNARPTNIFGWQCADCGEQQDTCNNESSSSD